MLNQRQLLLYTYRVSIYKPATLAAGGDIEATEEALNPTPAFTSVPGYYEGTMEVDEAMALGLTKLANEDTFDAWRFDASQPIADGWVIKMTGSDPKRPPHPNIGRFWVVRSNPKVAASQGARNANYVRVFSVLSNLPGFSQRVNNIS